MPWSSFLHLGTQHTMYNFISGKNSQHVSEPVYAGCQISESKNVTVTPSKKKMLKSEPIEPRNVTLFGNRVFEGIIKLKWHYN